MTVKIAMGEVARHVLSIIEHLNDKEIEQMVAAIEKAERIFLLGAGRSGLAARAFAMRLAQLGLTAYVIGDVTTPAMNDKDLMVVVSGSGATDSVVHAAKTAHGIGATVLSVTSYPNSQLGQISDNVVKVQGRTKIDIEKDHLKHQIEGHHSSLTPLGTLFEDTVMIFFDGIIAALMIDLQKGELDMKKRHALVE